MSFHFFMFDEPLFHTESSIETLLQEISEDPTSISITESQKQSLDEISQILLSDSSPIDPQLTHLQNCSVSEIKSEEEAGYGSVEYLTKGFLERSFSYGGYCFDEAKVLQLPFGGGLEVAENGGQMRRVSSTGDLPELRSNQATLQNVNSITTMMDEANFKVGRYSAQERKERIDRYKAKRTQRNFNKTIKYACRKTLADSRQRIRGRFVRSEEGGDITKLAGSFDDDDDRSGEGLHEEGSHEGKVVHGYSFVKGDQRAHYLNQYGTYFSHLDEKGIGC